MPDVKEARSVEIEIDHYLVTMNKVEQESIDKNRKGARKKGVTN